jgi:hypothetical protein
MTVGRDARSPPAAELVCERFRRPGARTVRGLSAVVDQFDDLLPREPDFHAVRRENLVLENLGKSSINLRQRDSGLPASHTISYLTQVEAERNVSIVIARFEQMMRDTMDEVAQFEHQVVLGFSGFRRVGTQRRCGFPVGTLSHRS